MRAFAKDGAIEERIDFGPSSKASLTYRLMRSEGSSDLSVNFADNALTVAVPASQADRWTSSDDVGIESQQSIGNSNSLSILIEKDFACLTPRAGEDDRDTFPNPAAGKAC